MSASLEIKACLSYALNKYAVARVMYSAVYHTKTNACSAALGIFVLLWAVCVSAFLRKKHKTDRWQSVCSVLCVL